VSIGRSCFKLRTRPPSLDFQEESRYELLAGAALGWLRSSDAAKETLDAEVFVDFGPMDVPRLD
jgi:hypothetical protein